MVVLERVMGIEPTTSAWKAEVLPLNYTRIYYIYIYVVMVGKTGFEPATPWSQTKCSTKLSYFPFQKHLIHFILSYSLVEELVARPRGVEPLTF
jgi:hypothetical protein